MNCAGGGGDVSTLTRDGEGLTGSFSNHNDNNIYKCLTGSFSNHNDNNIYKCLTGSFSNHNDNNIYKCLVPRLHIYM